VELAVDVLEAFGVGQRQLQPVTVVEVATQGLAPLEPHLQI
jgi:hypothetical protein